MALAEDTKPISPRRPTWRSRLLKLAASPRFQSWAARFPLTRGLVRREGEALFGIVQGFVASQVLFALVELRIPHRILERPGTAKELASEVGLAVDRMQRLLQAGAGLGLLRRRGDRFALSTRGAALIGVPGLEDMIRHHDLLYRDLADPVAFLRGDTQPELARFWPYVFGAGAAEDPDTARRYSDLMAQSQGLVAQEVLQTVSLQGTTRLMDIGGGTGAFAAAALKATPGLIVTLMDLPQVIDAARTRLAGSPVLERLHFFPGSFRDDPLPSGADAATLVRVLYDHADDTVTALLQKVKRALPPGGRLIVAEPMSGGETPDPIGDVYFAFYCMAMRTGTVRSQAEIAALLAEAGFVDIQTPRPLRAFVASVVTARVPSA
ncbi:methyltransferase [Thalassococcus sp. CAU 1522]|uniref:Methyltransferase n=1 Tax=Thalassococcus arenae TaxID=2851652 RepID=A0ABS6N5T9_9RHOB|nr:methyltransferase [Thalassococcus arenae]MBV2359389.1 methyltransferase [Thalassococcus arenae]